MNLRALIPVGGKRLSLSGSPIEVRGFDGSVVGTARSSWEGDNVALHIEITDEATAEILRTKIKPGEVTVG